MTSTLVRTCGRGSGRNTDDPTSESLRGVVAARRPEAMHIGGNPIPSDAMTIDRRGFLSASASALALGKSGLLTSLEPRTDAPAPPEIARSVPREVTVYTTADKTDYRLSRTATLQFKPMGQPLETQLCVFVDPTKRAQTILGIGGALTDASAETFAKLPPAKQRELL